MASVKEWFFIWHHLDIIMVEADGQCVAAVLKRKKDNTVASSSTEEEDAIAGISFKGPHGWTPCPDLSPRVALALERIEGEVNAQRSKDGSP